jgi:hypothetical protein
MAIQTPEYKVIKKEGSFELREYSDFIIAKVEVHAKKYDEAANRGFKLLADFIFGNNTKKVTISMTAPVGEEEISAVKDHTYVISFTMPKHYSLENLPVPNNKAVTFEKIPSHKVAVIRFSGFVNERTIKKKRNELETWITEQRVNPQGNFSSARYDPPWTLWFLRRNEVMVSVR